MSSKKLNVVIAGGSLGGLLHGLMLKRHGHNVTILEKNLTTSMTNLGAGLSCSIDMTTFMSQYDLVETPYCIETKGMRFLKSNGDINGERVRQDHVQKSTSWNTLYYRLRANFDGLESGYCLVPGPRVEDGKAAYWDGCTVEDVQYEEGEESVKLIYRDPRGQERLIEADLLIGTDGPSSTVRRTFQPNVERKYVGYIAWRGTVPARLITAESKERLGPSPVLCAIGNSGTYSYLIPGKNGDVSEGNRVYNWAWYRHCVFNSGEYTDVMTDNVTGSPHRWSLPLGRLLPAHAAALKHDAGELLAPAIAELIQKTEHPFIQALSDLVSPRAVFCGGKVLIAGDALATLRPTSALGLNSAARTATMLVEVLEGKMDLGAWEREAVGFAERARMLGINVLELFTMKETSEEAEGAEREIRRARKSKY